VSTFGIPFDDRVELAPSIAGWDKLALGQELRAAFPGARVAMANDAKAAALAEARWGALAGCDPAIYLNLGTGLSAALVIGGQVLAGANGAAGEIGYNLRALSDVGLALEARLPLEDMVSGRAMGGRSAGLAPGGRPPGGAPMSAQDAFGASAADARLGDLVSEFVTELAFHVVNLAIAVNPVRIAVGGGLVGSWDRLRPGLARALDAGTPFPPELVLARFPADAPLVGALALALSAAGAGRAEAGPVQVGPVEVGPVEVGPVEVGTAAGPPPVLHHPAALTERPQS
jgi:glucokinase